MMFTWKYIAVLLSVIFFEQQIAGQYTVHFIVTTKPGNKEIFLTGTFNNWDPGDQHYKLTPTYNQQAEITLSNLKAGRYQYKITRGTAITQECSAAGTNMRLRILMLEKDTTLQIKVEAWADDYFAMDNLSDSLLYEAMMYRAGYYADINMDSSYKYAVQLYQLAGKLNLPIKEARALDLQATIFTRQGNTEKALKLLLKSLAIKRSLNDSTGGTAFVYSSIAKIYENLQDYANAKENYTNAAGWLNKENEIYKAAPFVSIGNLFLRKENIDSAFYFANKAMAYDRNYGVLLLMGDIYKRKGSLQQALHTYKSAVLQSFRGVPGTPFYSSPTEAYKKMAEVFDEMHSSDSAFAYARKAFAIAANIKNPAAVISTSAVLIHLFKETHKYDSAFLYQELMIHNKDSLFTQEKERQVHNIYFTEMLREQELEAGNAKESARRKIYLLAGVVILLLLAGIGYRVTVKQRFNKQLAEIEMRALRAQMNPHFIFNCLASINRYIVKSDTKTASAYLTKFSKLIRLILDNSTSELVSIDAEIQTLKLYLDMESLRFDDAFEYEIQTDQLTRTDNTAIPAMIIQPYIENAIWHGLLHLADASIDGERKGKLWLRFIPLTEDTLQVEIEDNGIGRKKAAALRSKDAIKTKSYGMQISKDRIEIINTQYNTNSSVTIEDKIDASGNSCGTKVILQLPIIEMAIHPDTVKKAV